MNGQKFFIVKFQQWSYSLYMLGMYPEFRMAQLFFSTEEAAKKWIEKNKQEQQQEQKDPYRRNYNYEIIEEYFMA